MSHSVSLPCKNQLKDPFFMPTLCLLLLFYNASALGKIHHFLLARTTQYGRVNLVQYPKAEQDKCTWALSRNQLPEIPSWCLDRASGLVKHQSSEHSPQHPALHPGAAFSLTGVLSHNVTGGQRTACTWSNMETWRWMWKHRIQTVWQWNKLSRKINSAFITFQDSTGHLTRKDNLGMLMAFTKPFVVLDTLFIWSKKESYSAAILQENIMNK